MKYITFFCCAFLLLLFDEQYSQGQNWLWGQQSGSSIVSSVYYSPITTDKYGNAYVTGTFENSTTFGSYVLTGNTTNAYLAKFNSAGNVVWAKQATDDTNGYSISESITTDKYGNVFIAGNMTGIVTFGRFVLTARKGYCAFLVKYDSNGNVLWARQSTTLSNNGAYNCSIATDDSGNAIITGLFDTLTHFGRYFLTNFNLPALNVFVVKYTSWGSVVWARQSTGMGLSNNFNYPFSIATDSSGNIYITSDFNNFINFGGYILSSRKYYSIYLVKYSPGGSVLWAQQSFNSGANIFGSGYSLGYGYSVITDHANNVYITGTFQDSVTFGNFTMTSPGGYSVFFVKYDNSGNVIWAQQSSQGWSGTGLAVDDSNHIYISGQVVYYYLNSNELKFGGLELTVDPDKNTASFIIKFNADGTPYCGSILDGVGENGENTGVAANASGSCIYMGGIFYNKEIICGPDTLIPQAGAGESSLLIARWQPCYDTQTHYPSIPQPVPAEIPPCNVFIPNAFSPSQSINNVLYVRSTCLNTVKFLVFDRWGNKVFESDDVNRGWDGTLNGQPMNTGTYIYYVKATLDDGTNVERNGNVTLVR